MSNEKNDQSAHGKFIGGHVALLPILKEVVLP